MQTASPFFVLDLRLDHFANCRQNDSRAVVVVVDRTEIYVVLGILRVARAHTHVVDVTDGRDLFVEQSEICLVRVLLVRGCYPTVVYTAAKTK